MYSTSQHSTRHGGGPSATASSRSTRPTSSASTSSSSSDLSAERAMMLRIQAKLERTHRRLEREHAVQSASIPRSMRYPLPPQSTQPQPAVKSVRVEDMPATISRHGHAAGTYKRRESGEVPLSSAYRTMTHEQQMQTSQRSHRQQQQQQSREGETSRGIASRRMEPPGTSAHREYPPSSRHPYDTYMSRQEGVRANSYEDQYARPPSPMASPFLMYSSQRRPPPSTAATRHNGHHDHPATSRHGEPQQSHRVSSRAPAPQQQQHHRTTAATDAAPSTTRVAAAPPSSRVRFQGYEDDRTKAAAVNGHRRQEPERERAPEKDRHRHEDQSRVGRTHRHEPSNRPTEARKSKVPPRSEIDTSAMLLIDDLPAVTSPREGRHRRSLDEVRSGINIMAYDDSHLPPVLNADLALIGQRRPRSNSLHEHPVSSRGTAGLSPAPAAEPSPTMRERRPRRNSLVEPPPRSEIKVSAFKTVVAPAVEPKKPHMPPTSAINMWALSDSPPLGPQKPTSPSPPAVEPSPQPSSPAAVEPPPSPVPAFKELEVQTQPSSEEFPVVDATSSEGENDSQTDDEEEMQMHDQPQAELKEEPQVEERQEEQQEFGFSDEESNQESEDDADNNFETASFEPLETHHEVAEEAEEEAEEPTLQSPPESVHAKTTPVPQSSIQTNAARPPYSRPLMTMSQRLGRSPPRLPTAPPSAKPASARALPSHPQLPTAYARAPATTMGRPTVSRPRSPIPAAPKTAGSAALTVPTALSARRVRTRGPLDLKHQMPPSLSALSGLSNGSTSFVLNELSFYDVEWKSGEFGFSVQPVYAEQHEDFHDANNERQVERMYLRMLLNTDRSTCKSFRTVRVGDVLVQIGDQQVSELVHGEDLSGSALTKLFAHLSTQTPMRLTFQRMDLLDWDGGVEL